MSRGQVTVTLGGSSTFRDLGGIRAADGRRIRVGQLYRADALAELGIADRALVGGLGLKLVCDLRSLRERRAMPCLDWLSPAPRSLHLELAPVLEAGTAPSLEALRRAPDVASATALMLRTYELLPEACAPRLGELFSALRAEGLPALIHCSAGKDRTGFVVAMLLSALEVPRPAIFADYLRSAHPEHAARAEARTALIMQLILGRPLDAAALAAMSSVRAEFLDASFAAIERDHGSVSGYLERAAGLDAATRRELQALLLE